MNPRQRRGVLLLGLATLGGLAVFIAVASYVANVRKNVKPEITVLMLKHAVPAQQSVTVADLKPRKMPKKFVPSQAIADPTVIGNRVAGQPLPSGALLQEGMLVAPPELERGQREIAVLISADTGVAGKIQPGDLVDVNATFDGDQRSVPRARTILSRARIVTIGLPRSGPAKRFADTTPGGQSNSPSGTQGETVVPVTFALGKRGVQILTYAESFADEVRLALIKPGDDSQIAHNHLEYTLPATKRRAPR